MSKYAIIAKSEDIHDTQEIDDFDIALEMFIITYSIGGFNNVDLIDATTGEVFAYFCANPRKVWQSDEVTDYMIQRICEMGGAKALLDIIMQ